MARCRVCGARSPLTASGLAVCAPCLRTGQPDLWLHLARVHERTRRPFGLPSAPPRDPGGLLCDLCANQCRIPSGEHDRPMTSREHPGEAPEAAKAAGPTRVRTGNVHLLGEPYGHASHPTV